MCYHITSQLYTDNVYRVQTFDKAFTLTIVCYHLNLMVILEATPIENHGLFYFLFFKQALGGGTLGRGAGTGGEEHVARRC
ncbi:hypothetical protein RchiOBHm_Chr1g0339971 [Rosa chinensis]|uniref:Uncharacterized protein n=1 Tax=Rosa chinensis TaxID=74649 RepID=A0A2P6SDD2_ROSCH|nr:hypothetical protein RchiOBHm_Chr1g0339971 [Rosa chinensis]